MDATEHERALSDALAKVREALDVRRTTGSVLVSLTIEEATALLTAPPVRESHMHESMLARVLLDAEDVERRLTRPSTPDADYRSRVLDTGSDGSEPPDAQALYAQATLAGYGFPPVHIGQGE